MSLEGKVETYLEYEIKDREGKIVKKGKVKAKSWVKNFARLIRTAIGYGGAGWVDRDGNAHGVVRDNLPTLHAFAGEGNANYGVLVGKGTSPPTKDDASDVYDLADQIPHGDGDDMLHYMGTDEVDIAVSDKTVTYKWTRDFKNNGSVDVTVKEVALAVKLTLADTDYYFLMFHTVLASPVSVPAGATITWRVVLKYTA